MDGCMKWQNDQQIIGWMKGQMGWNDRSQNDGWMDKTKE